jgi:DNA-directed RNA polymerase subunit RPC12/RpoP
LRRILSVENPALAKQWDYEKNHGVTPDMITAGSEYRAFWLCEKHGHSWDAYVYSRNQGRDCPYCSNQKLLTGFNDLQTLNPELADEWDCENNNDLTPSDVLAGSTAHYAWKCKKHGHAWTATAKKRRYDKQGCPYCNRSKVWVGFNDIPTTHPAIANEWNYKRNAKRQPEDYTSGADVKVWWKCKSCDYEWEAVIYSRASKKPAGCPCCAGNILVIGKNDLQSVNPALALQWDYAKNTPLTPSDIAANSAAKAWWLDARGHSWDATIASRNAGRGCPYCANRQLLRGFNDLSTRNPNLVSEWDDEANAPLTATDVVATSHDYAWWKCERGHSWRSQIVNRSVAGTDCPYCTHREVSPGETDLATVRPDIADAWDYEQNYPLTPDQVTAWTKRKVWWMCKKCGLSYKTAICNRGSADSCPHCHGKIPIVGKTDFASVHPELLDDWDYEQNVLPPTAYTCGSDKKVWWHCTEGHSWQASICDRRYGGTCPYCNGTLAIPGETDAATITPELLLEWDTERNAEYDLRNLKPFANIKFWWKCNTCHKSWQSTLGARTTGSRCPHCNGKVTFRPRLVM